MRRSYGATSFLPKKKNNHRTRLRPNPVFRFGTNGLLSKLIYACFAGSGSAFLDFLLNGLRISSFTLADKMRPAGYRCFGGISPIKALIEA